MKTLLSNLTAIAQNTQSNNIRMIDIDELHASEDNFFSIERIDEFAATILGQGGVKDNLLVTPLESGGYEIISGHRRTAAVRYLLEHGEAISRLLPCLVQKYESEDERLLDLVLMNVSTRQLSDQELWRSYRMIDEYLKKKKEAGERFGKMREALADKLGVSPAQVSKLQNVAAHAIEPVQEAVANGSLSIHAANEIAKLDETQQEELAAGDLSEVTPRTVQAKKASPGSHSPKKDAARKVATSSNFSKTSALTEAVPNRNYNESAEEKAMLGYLTLTLRAMGMDADTVKQAQQLMFELFKTKSSEDAQEAYMWSPS